MRRLLLILLLAGCSVDISHHTHLDIRKIKPATQQVKTDSTHIDTSHK